MILVCFVAFHDALRYDGGVAAEYFEYSCWTRIVCEPRAWRSIGREIARLGVARAWFAADPALAARVDDAAPSLAEEGIALAGVWTEVPPDSDSETAERLAAQVGPDDALVALGGGSAIDTAKAANIVGSLGGRLADHEGAGVLPDRLGPILAAPTTAGTGSEVSFAATVMDRAEGRKVLFFSPSLACDVAVLDPELTVGLPPRLTAATGADALTHAIEAIFAVNASPLTDAMAVLAIRRIRCALPRAVRDGSDIEARRDMLVAAAAAGIAFSNAGVGIVHAMAHAVGALFGVHHGTANAILLPVGMAFNLEAVPERAGILAEALGTRPPEVVGCVERLLAECGLPRRLKEVGVEPLRIGEAVEYALTDGSMAFNPREASPQDVERLLRAVAQ
jgi:alcohol dehydrogenase